MIDPKLPSDQKLPAAREMYKDADDHYSKCNDERHRCARNYHNTGGLGQWDAEAKKILDDEDRPALTFNLIKRFVDTGIGMHMDMQRKAVARPVGAEDQFMSRVLEAICGRIDDSAGTEFVDADVMRDGYIIGEGDGHVDVVKDPKHPGWIKFKHFAASPYDVLWDPGSVKLNRSDATYVCYSRWLGKSEFSQEYPDHAKEWENLVDTESPGASISAGDFVMDGVTSGPNDYKNGTLYYDKFKKRACIIHLEYAVPKKVLFASINGETVIVTPEEKESMQGMWEFEGVQWSSEWDEEIHALEFIGTKVLYDSTEDDLPYQPYDGFSLASFVYAMDTEDNIPYGPIRNAIDPQGRVNKAFSIMLEHLVGQHKPGYIAEKSAVKDVDSFETALSQSGSVAIVEDGSVTNGALRERPMPQPSPAAQQQIEVSTQMLERVFGLGNDLIQPAASQEAATTVSIRYHKSQLSLSDVRRSYDLYQSEIKRRKLQTITRAMPDDQIEALLGNKEKYRVQNGMVIELGPDPQQPGQMMVVNQANIRGIEMDIELESSSTNTTLRMLDLQTFMQAQAQGIPIDPMLIVEKMAGNRAEREQLRRYVEQVMQSQAQQQQLEMQNMKATIGQTLQIEAGKAMETARHNLAEEELKEDKQEGDLAAQFAAILEKAEGAEKRTTAEQYKVLQQRLAGREQAAIRASQPRTQQGG
jgi:hypothetical protein